MFIGILVVACMTTYELVDSVTGEPIDPGDGSQGTLSQIIYKRLSDRKMDQYRQRVLQPFYAPLRIDYVQQWPSRTARHQTALRAKEAGNAAFKNSDFSQARTEYEHAKNLLTAKDLSVSEDNLVDAYLGTKALQSNDLTKDEAALLAVLHSNLAQVALNSAELFTAVLESTQALELQPSNAKARVRRAKAFARLGAADLAETDMHHFKRSVDVDELRSILATSNGLNEYATACEALDALKDAPATKWKPSFTGDDEWSEVHLETLRRCTCFRSWEEVASTLRSIQTLVWTSDRWEDLAPVLVATTQSWNAPRAEKLLDALLPIQDFGSVRQLRLLPAVLAHARFRSDDERHAIWRASYDRERKHIAHKSATFTGRATPAARHITWEDDDTSMAGSVPHTAYDTLMIHAMATAHGRSDLIAIIEGMLNENVLYTAGATMLHHYARAGKAPLVQFLLDRGANPNCLDGGTGADPSSGYYASRSTPLDYAILSLAQQLDDEASSSVHKAPAPDYVRGLKTCIQVIGAAGGKQRSSKGKRPGLAESFAKLMREATEKGEQAADKARDQVNAAFVEASGDVMMS